MKHWFITPAAIEQYLRIKGLSPHNGKHAADAQRELEELAAAIVEAGKPGKELDSGAYQFRGPKPLRLRLLVSYQQLRPDDLPQLIEVKPDHEGRKGSYERSGPGREAMARHKANVRSRNK